MKLYSFLFVVAVALCLPLAQVHSVHATPQVEESRHFAIRAAEIYTLDSRFPSVRNAWMEIRDGRIIRVATGDIPSYLDVLDMGDATIMPGFVACDVAAPSLREGRNVAASYVSADRFDPFADHKDLWSKGITTARLSPPKNWFVGGVGSVVRLGGRPQDAQVLSVMSDMDIHFDDAGGLGAPVKGVVPVPSSSDVALIPGRTVRPRSRLGRITALRDLLSNARQHALDRDGWAHETGLFDPTLAAVSRFVETRRPLRLVARRAADIRQAISASTSLGYPCVLAGADESMAFAAEIKSAGMGVILRVDESTGKIGDDSFDRVTPRGFDPRTFGVLDKAGISVALTRDDNDLLRAVAIVGAEVSSWTALRAITSTAADILGLGKVGRLTKGSYADFVVLNGRPFVERTHVVETWVAGRRVWRRDSPRSLVIYGAKVHDGLGNVYTNGAVVIEDGRVVDCGASIGVPVGARVIRAPRGAVITPGFIDGHGHIGIASDRRSMDASVDMGQLFAVERPEFRHLANAGVTTVCVAPKTRSSKGTPVAVIKTAQGSHDNLVREALGAVLFSASGDYAKTKSTLSGTMAQVKKYDEAWKKYATDLAKWKAEEAKKTAAPTSAKKPEAKSKEATKKESKPVKDDPITGTWEFEIVAGPMPLPEGQEKMKLSLVLDDKGNITGSATSPVDPDDTLPITGKLTGKSVKLEIALPEGEVPIPDAKLTVEATLDGPDHMSGTLDLAGLIKMEISGIRVEKGIPVIKVRRTSKKKTVTKGPKKPKYDARLEAMRRVLTKEVGVMVAVANGDQMRAAVDVFRALKLPVALLGSSGAHDALKSIRGDGVGILLSHGLHRSRRGKTSVFVPNEIAVAGVPFAFQSSAGASAARLPELASNAVRAGLSPERALQALTGNAASMLGLQDRVGSFRPGCDGDVLIFSGGVFESGTRLLRVFVRGEEVKR